MAAAYASYGQGASTTQVNYKSSKLLKTRLKNSYFNFVSLKAGSWPGYTTVGSAGYATVGSTGGSGGNAGSGSGAGNAAGSAVASYSTMQKQ